MNIASLGGLIGAAGTPLAQTRGADADRAAQETNAAQRQLRNAERASDAAGIGQTDEDQQADDGEADGRRLWERPNKPLAPEAAATADAQAAGDSATQPVKDPSGECGNLLDLIG